MSVGDVCHHGAISSNMPHVLGAPYTPRSTCLECCWTALVEANGGEEPRVIMDNSGVSVGKKWKIIGASIMIQGPTLINVIRNATLQVNGRNK
jgi:hypothetical protein